VVPLQRSGSASGGPHSSPAHPQPNTIISQTPQQQQQGIRTSGRREGKEGTARIARLARRLARRALRPANTQASKARRGRASEAGSARARARVADDAGSARSICLTQGLVDAEPNACVCVLSRVRTDPSTIPPPYAAPPPAPGFRASGDAFPARRECGTQQNFPTEGRGRKERDTKKEG
jgi:hypothetical protein